MLTMQSFYTQLFQTPQLADPNLDGLKQLTEAEPAQVAVLKSGLDWGAWDAETA